MCESDAAISPCGAAIVVAVAVSAALALAEYAPVVHAATKFDPRAVVAAISVAAEVAACDTGRKSLLPDLMRLLLLVRAKEVQCHRNILLLLI